MNYQDIQRIIVSKGLADDPAFVNLYVHITPTPNMNGHPLGMYYSDRSLIVLQPNLPASMDESVLLHELGHRHGDYHYNDLSEQYAEHYRAMHQNNTGHQYVAVRTKAVYNGSVTKQTDIPLLPAGLFLGGLAAILYGASRKRRR